MTTIYLSNGTSELTIGERPKLQTCVSIVVDDVDGDDTSNSCHESCSSNSVNHLPHGQQLVFFINSPADGGLQMDNDVFGDDNADARSDVSYGSKSSRGSTSREESESRLQQIKDEVQHRRDEFARLLDEHEQVVRELRRIESSGELQALAEMGSSRAEEAASSFLNLTQKHQDDE